MIENASTKDPFFVAVLVPEDNDYNWRCAAWTEALHGTLCPSLPVFTAFWRFMIAASCRVAHPEVLFFRPWHMDSRLTLWIGVQSLFHDFYNSICLHFHSKNQVIECLPLPEHHHICRSFWLCKKTWPPFFKLKGCKSQGCLEGFIGKVWDFTTFFC